MGRVLEGREDKKAFKVTAGTRRVPGVWVLLPGPSLTESFFYLLMALSRFYSSELHLRQFDKPDTADLRSK